MTSPATPPDPEQQRRSAVRHAWVLAGVAVLIMIAFMVRQATR